MSIFLTNQIARERAALSAARQPQPPTPAQQAQIDFNNGYAVGLARERLLRNRYIGSKDANAPTWEQAEAWISGTSSSWQAGWVAGVTSTGGNVMFNGWRVQALKDGTNGYVVALVEGSGQAGNASGYWLSVDNATVKAKREQLAAATAAATAAAGSADMGVAKYLPWNW
jgi:hypothetical protein